MSEINKVKFIEKKEKWYLLTRDGGRANGSCCLTNTKFQFCKMESSLEKAAQQQECTHY